MFKTQIQFTRLYGDFIRRLKNTPEGIPLTSLGDVFQLILAFPQFHENDFPAIISSVKKVIFVGGHRQLSTLPHFDEKKWEQYTITNTHYEMWFDHVDTLAILIYSESDIHQFLPKLWKYNPEICVALHAVEESHFRTEVSHWFDHVMETFQILGLHTCSPVFLVADPCGNLEHTTTITLAHSLPIRAEIIYSPDAPYPIFHISHPYGRLAEYIADEFFKRFASIHAMYIFGHAKGSIARSGDILLPEHILELQHRRLYHFKNDLDILNIYNEIDNRAILNDQYFVTAPSPFLYSEHHIQEMFEAEIPGIEINLAYFFAALAKFPDTENENWEYNVHAPFPIGVIYEVSRKLKFPTYYYLNRLNRFLKIMKSQIAP